MERQTKIVDASIILKWFLNEEDSDKALILKEKYMQKEILLIIPDLLFIEVANVLKYKKQNLEKINMANEYLWDLQLNIKGINKDFLYKAIEISLKYNLTVYDSIYIALAQSYDCELITADEELAKCPNVKLLNEIE